MTQPGTTAAAATTDWMVQTCCAPAADVRWQPSGTTAGAQLRSASNRPPRPPSRLPLGNELVPPAAYSDPLVVLAARGWTAPVGWCRGGAMAGEAKAWARLGRAGK